MKKKPDPIQELRGIINRNEARARASRKDISAARGAIDALETAQEIEAATIGALVKQRDAARRENEGLTAAMDEIRRNALAMLGINEKNPAAHHKTHELIRQARIIHESERATNRDRETMAREIQRADKRTIEAQRAELEAAQRNYNAADERGARDREALEGAAREIREQAEELRTTHASEAEAIHEAARQRDRADRAQQESANYRAGANALQAIIDTQRARAQERQIKINRAAEILEQLKDNIEITTPGADRLRRALTSTHTSIQEAKRTGEACKYCATPNGQKAIYTGDPRAPKAHAACWDHHNPRNPHDPDGIHTPETGTCNADPENPMPCPGLNNCESFKTCEHLEPTEPIGTVDETGKEV